MWSPGFTPHHRVKPGVVVHACNPSKWEVEKEEQFEVNLGNRRLCLMEGSCLFPTDLNIDSPLLLNSQMLPLLRIVIAESCWSSHRRLHWTDLWFFFLLSFCCASFGASSSLVDCQRTPPHLAVVAEGVLSSSCPPQSSHFRASER